MTAGPAITFIGAGQMGLPMVRRLVDAGCAVTAYARRSEARAACEAAGAYTTDDLRASVEAADAVVVCVFSDDQLFELALGPEGFIDAMAPGAMLLIHTTGSPATSRALAEHGADRQLRVVEAPVSGSAEDISAGHVTVLLAGDDADVERARPIVAAYGDPVLHLGPLGSAQAVKLLNNALFAAQVQLLADVERLAGEMGTDWAVAAAAIRHSSGTSRALDIVASMGSVNSLVDRGGHFLRKDVAAVAGAAADLGLDLGQLGEVNRHGRFDFLEASTDHAATAETELGEIEAIKQLKARYFRLLDTKDWDAFADLFTADCEHVLPTDDAQPPVTNDQYLAHMRRTLTDAVTVHHGHMPEITLLGPTEATGIWAMFDYVEIPQGPDAVRLKGYGHYYETYRKCADGRWRISSKRNVRLHVDRLPPRAG